MLVFTPLALAESYEELMAMNVDPGPPITEPGVIREINLADRSMIISGYLYVVAPPFQEDSLVVELLGTSAGAFELLQEDMKVEVTYHEYQFGRVALSIKQVDDDVEVEF